MQHSARQSKEYGLDMRDLQVHANPCNTSIIIRNEQQSGSSRLVGSHSVLDLQIKASNRGLSYKLVRRMGSGHFHLATSEVTEQPLSHSHRNSSKISTGGYGSERS
jgi:hypothetical protein